MKRATPSIQADERRRGSTAFTLVEILIVVIILGILAAIVIPQFSSASQQAKEASLRDDLRFMRTQIGVFAVQHRDIPPGYPGGNTSAAPTASDFIDHMTLHSDVSCNTNTVATPVYKFGPYLARMPANPLNGLETVMVIVNGMDVPEPDDLTGWIYKPETQHFQANSVGIDQSGVAYSSY